MGTYIKYLIRSLLVAVLAVSLSAGSSLKVFRDKSNDYLLAERTKQTEIPAELDTPPFNEVMVIPDVIDSRGISGQEFELPLPDPLSGSYGVDRIVIRRLGDNHWIFLDSPTASIWPKLREYFIQNNLSIESEIPSQGILETEWLVSRDGSADEIYASVTSGKAKFDSRSSIENRFRMRVEPGVRQGSSEVRIQYLQTTLGYQNKQALEWGKKPLAVNVAEVQDKLLTELALYMGENINQSSTISLLASGIGGESRVVLVPDKVKPVLKYSLDFDRTWSMVGSALGAAGIEIEDRDRTSALYYILYSEKGEKAGGMFSRLFSRDDSVPKEEINRFMIKLDESAEEIEVTVHKNESTLANADLAERLLKIIKEYST